MTGGSSLDSILERYIGNASDGYKDAVQSAAVVVKDQNGKTLYSKAVGKQTFSDDALSPAFTEDTVAWVASMAKLFTSVCAMQMVEKGLIGLDEDVARVIPELGEGVEVLKGFDEQAGGKPILAPKTKPITMRTLLSHTAGFAYDERDPELLKWAAHTGQKTGAYSTYDGYLHPLKFEPGEGWCYGVGIDWAGRVVEVLSGCTLEEYMQKNVFAPLDMHSSTLLLHTRPDLRARKADVGQRDAGTGRLVPNTQLGEKWRHRLGGGGAALFSTANDYAKILGSLISGDGKLVTEQSFQLLRSPQLSSAAARENFHAFCMAPYSGQDFAPPPIGMEASHGLGGSVMVMDAEGKRKKGTMSWAGYTNPNWWIDRESGIAVVFVVQTEPPADVPSLKLLSEVETAIYKEFGQQ